MNILFSADCFYPAQVGGPANTIYWQAKALTRAGHAVSVVATSLALPPEIGMNKWISMDCGQVIYTRNPHFYLPIVHIWRGWQAIKKADVVHINSFFYPASIGWVFMSRLRGKPVVWSPHGELNPVALSFYPQRKRFALAIVRLLNPAVHFQATSAAEADHIRHRFGPDSSVSTVLSRMELPALHIPDSNAVPYLLFIGRIHPIKAIDRLIMALSTSTIFREGRYKLLIAGLVVDETYANQLNGLIQTLGLSEKATFLGPVQGDEKQRLYANARLTILPSHAENFGNVVIESLAQGTPVVASTNTPWQLLQTERAGSWVSNDHKPLTQAIETYLTMPANEYINCRERAYALACRRFDSREGVDEWEQLYQQAIRKKRNVAPKNAINFHDRIATDFDQKYTTSKAFQERFTVFTTLFNQYILPESQVMDLGCGAGVFSEHLAQNGCIVTGIDGSEAMIELAGSKKTSGRVRYVVASLPLPDAAAFAPQDVVLLSSVLEYVPDLSAMLNQAYTLLKPGGLLIVSMPNRRSMYRRLERWLFRLTGRPRYFGHVRYTVTETDFTRQLATIGFVPVKTVYFSGQDPVSRALRIFLPMPYTSNLFVGVYWKAV